MKTFIFTEDQLDETLANWVKDAIATGHPKAIKNAKLVAAELKEILVANTKLYKEDSKEPKEGNDSALQDNEPLTLETMKKFAKEGW